MKEAAEERKMRGSDLAEAMASAVDRMVNAREGTGALDRAIEPLRRSSERMPRSTWRPTVQRCLCGTFRKKDVLPDFPEWRCRASMRKCCRPDSGRFSLCFLLHSFSVQGFEEARAVSRNARARPAAPPTCSPFLCFEANRHRHLFAALFVASQLAVRL